MPGLRLQGCGKCAFSLVFLLLLSISASAQKEAGLSSRRPKGEQATARALALARTNPLALRAFLVAMPKGGDLHNHLRGAVYAETLIRDAAEDKLCVDPARLSFSRPEAAGPAPPACGEGKVPASDAYDSQHLYDALVDALSMRGFVPSPGVTGHDHFFAAFARDADPPQRSSFASHMGKWLDEVDSPAASEVTKYLEPAQTPDFSHAAAIAR